MDNEVYAASVSFVSSFLLHSLCLFLVTLSNCALGNNQKSWFSLPQGLCLVQEKRFSPSVPSNTGGQLNLNRAAYVMPLEQLITCPRDFLDGTKTPDSCALLPHSQPLPTIAGNTSQALWVIWVKSLGLDLGLGGNIPLFFGGEGG